MRFSRAAGDTVGVTAIPTGQVVARSDGTLYNTTAAGTVLNGDSQSGDVPVIAQQAGSASNSGVGTLTILKSPPSRIVACINPIPATGGIDEESDASLRERVRAHCRSLARCNPTAVRQGVLGYTNGLGQQVRFLKLQNVPPRFNLYLDDGTGALDVYDVIPAGEVLIASAPAGETLLFLERQALRTAPTRLWRYDSGGVLVASLLLSSGDYTVELAWGQIQLRTPLDAGDQVVNQTSYTAYSGLVADVQRVLDGDPYDRVATPGHTGAGVVGRALPALAQLVDLELAVTYRSGLSATALVAAQTAVVDALLQLVNGLDIGLPLYRARIIDVVMGLAEVENVVVNVPAVDLYPSVNQVLRTDSTHITLL